MIQSPAAMSPSALKIFVVEDHPDTLTYLRLYLESRGHTVVSARSINEASAALPQSECQALISDVGLPDGDGWELLRCVRLPQGIYAVSMSGFGTADDVLRSKQAGYRHHLRKPFKPTEPDAMLAEAAQEWVAEQPGKVV